MSLPFAGDQNSLARKCSEFGLGTLVAEQMALNHALPAADRFANSIANIVENYDALQSGFDDALEWDAKAIKARPKILNSILEKI